MFMLQKYHWFSTITMVVIKHYVIIDMVGLLSIIAVNITIRHYWYIKTIVFITLLTDHSIHLFFDRTSGNQKTMAWYETKLTRQRNKQTTKNLFTCSKPSWWSRVEQWLQEYKSACSCQQRWLPSCLREKPSASAWEVSPIFLNGIFLERYDVGFNLIMRFRLSFSNVDQTKMMGQTGRFFFSVRCVIIMIVYNPGNIV